MGEAFEDAEPDVGGDGRDVERVCGHAGPYVRKRKKHEAMMCRILSDFTYLTLTKVFCLGDNDDDDEHTSLEFQFLRDGCRKLWNLGMSRVHH